MTTMRFATSEGFNSLYNTSFGSYSGGAYGMDMGMYAGYTGDYTSILESRYNTLQTSQAYEIGSAGDDSVLSSKIDNFTSYIEKGKEDKALNAYNELLEQMKLQTRYSQLITEDGDDTQLRAVARQLIEGDTGIDLEELIRDNTRTQSQVEYQTILTNGNCDVTSQEDLLAQICDIDEEEGSVNFIAAGWAHLTGWAVQGWNSLFNGGKKM